MLDPTVVQPNQRFDYDVQCIHPRHKYLGQKFAWCHSPSRHGYNANLRFVPVPYLDESRQQKPQNQPLIRCHLLSAIGSHDRLDQSILQYWLQSKLESLWLLYFVSAKHLLAHPVDDP
ncbi:hypothetical protein D3C73_1367150 [compost metagenome]